MAKEAQTDFSVVGLGASAGGLDAFHQFFSHLPANCGMAFVVILHLPAEHKSLLSEILSRWTSMPVTEIAPGDWVGLRPNHVYVPYPHTIVTVRDGGLHVEQPEEHARLLRPIDGFFDSLGAALHERAVGIVLSGTGSDGALGLKALRESGGLTIAQGYDGIAPQYGEMPGGAIATGAVDLVAPVQDMPGHLVRLRSRILDGGAKEHEDAHTLEARRLEICALLHKQLNHDFTDYRRQTFLRRVERRMLVVNAPTIDAYVDRLRSDSGEVQSLFLDLLIRVTSFFRDADTFATLASEVIPQLFAGKAADGNVRIWVPGCATGEEAYSLAMLVREHLDSLSAPPKVQIFASDIDEAAIGTARLGRYPQTLIQGLSEPRRRRFFHSSHGSCVVTKEIRELCTFSLHSVIRDPPFSMMSLVSCRNLLIYMNPKLQSRVIPVFHYALVPEGILLLGGSESVAQHSELFDVVDAKARIFKRREGRRPSLNLPWQRPQKRPGGENAMQHPEGQPSADLDNGRSRGSNDLRETPKSVTSSARFEKLLANTEIDANTVGQLKAALSTVFEELQSLAEEHQTALEELRSSNEELHSVNEELQSTNEELETSKEEMQSLNEELHTVNLRLTEKVEELDHAHTDLKNLFDSTQIATVFLDRHLVIRNFTPAIVNLYNLIPSDHGRPLSDIVSRLRYSNLREDVAHVLSTLEPLERRVARDDDTVHYIMRVLPYREPDSTVSGVLVTFVDVTSIVRAEEALVEADARKDVFLATLSHELRNPLAPIRMAARLLQAPNLEPAQLAHARDIIERQVGNLASLLEDLLDISRITHNSFPLKKGYFDVREVVNAAVESVQSALEAKRHELRVELPDTQIVVEVDQVRITQAITNLLTNAIKYTPAEGLIRLSVRLDGQALSIAVRDNGIGLTSEAMQKVFDMFTRIESRVARTEGGLGIGLALAKGLVRLHGGRLEVRSAGPGQGSEFAIRLPRSVVVDRLPESSPDPEKPDAASPSLRILVADDNQDAAETLRMFLASSGHDVTLACTGVEALQFAHDLRPDACVFDLGMPELSGYEAAERIRREAWGKDMTLIAITGWGQATDKRHALASGFNHHLTKPCDPDQLVRILRGARA